ncbi:Cytochrome P450, partial [Mycobacterium rhizamassiliense]
LSRHEDVAAAFKDFETYSSARGVTLDQVSSGEVISETLVQFLDPPAHRRMRGLVNKVFTPRAVMSLEPMVRATIERYFSRLDPDSFDVVADFSAYFPVEVIATMLGLPEEDRQADERRCAGDRRARCPARCRAGNLLLAVDNEANLAAFVNIAGTEARDFCVHDTEAEAIK